LPTYNRSEVTGIFSGGLELRGCFLFA